MPRRTQRIAKCVGALLGICLFGLAAFTAVYFLQDTYPCIYQLPFTHVCMSNLQPYCCMRSCTDNTILGCSPLDNQPNYTITQYATYGFVGLSLFHLILLTFCCCSTEITLPNESPESKIDTERSGR